MIPCRAERPYIGNIAPPPLPLPLPGRWTRGEVSLLAPPSPPRTNGYCLVSDMPVQANNENAQYLDDSALNYMDRNRSTGQQLCHWLRETENSSGTLQGYYGHYPHRVLTENKEVVLLSLSYRRDSRFAWNSQATYSLSRTVLVVVYQPSPSLPCTNGYWKMWDVLVQFNNENAQSLDNSVLNMALQLIYLQFQ